MAKDNSPSTDLSLGITITDARTGSAVLRDNDGPVWSCARWIPARGKASGTTTIQVPAGEYSLKSVLRRQDDGLEINGPGNLWSDKRRVKVLPGKEVVIDIPWQGN